MPGREHRGIDHRDAAEARKAKRRKAASPPGTVRMPFWGMASIVLGLVALTATALVVALGIIGTSFSWFGTGEDKRQWKCHR